MVTSFDSPWWRAGVVGYRSRADERLEQYGGSFDGEEDSDRDTRFGPDAPTTVAELQEKPYGLG